ncbi:MAG: hypothetical protein JNM76_12505 [Betaproteobacteria bacterium]|nr:hypothetical protein [Betaproteobacteria bacterium]
MVYGDAVNVAALVAALNNELGTSILLAEIPTVLATMCGPLVEKGMRIFAGDREEAKVFLWV